ncbi:DMT family transporter [Lentilactobacillus kefiri]|jgi:quaternary ammonium compound-resistance protein SugE|uniref:Small multidrug resistance protein n=2 Tax=Lentilactobacillus kefiri TaxID=33962 RepID=A0A8E1V1E0_LENKE|nr:multidrug efflux SMR transporter [Lentilactobacillus kefiri]KRL73466.1 small multidrug resistance protein [Lentilactobacillus parakefiri DSM 10551]KRM49675.1 small multidrug resistance protein [Lentilactobacillus kefiri DSM 20587 = JCM 5818]MCJ2162467.1 multidrug efflux SMR transporter [Lentilactobacillus kefiri]MCP9369697.1 multidrug efflux SMR transporter [Lentilactobacillus kefiri]MDH5109622.1 multidrug efflux SMR transporter [Lentilactobacillus kefiri]
MNWVFLVIAGIFEVVWATAMKYSHGFTNLMPSIVTIAGMLISFFLLAHATKTLPLSIAYPVWTGIGAVGTVIAGIVLFGDKISPITWGFVILLLVSIVGIKMTS